MKMTRLLLAIISALPLAAQFGSGSDPRWRTVGAGAAAAAPATCTSNRDVYMCTGAGCVSGNRILYCVNGAFDVQGTAGGSGITGLNGLNGATQTFTDDTNVTVVSGGTAHVITWAGQLSPARGGTGDDTSASTGVPRIAAGNWTYDAGISHLAASTSAHLAGVLSDETGFAGGGVAVGSNAPTMTLTNATGLPVGSVTGLGTGVGTWLATPSCANLAAAVTGETGTGGCVFDQSPTIVTPTIASFANATHTHQDAAGGGTLVATSIFASGTVPTARLGSGTANSSTFLRGDQTWATPAGSGDFVGPGSSTDNAILRFDGTTGKLGQNSGATIDDSANFSTTGSVSTGTGGTVSGRASFYELAASGSEFREWRASDTYGQTVVMIIPDGNPGGSMMKFPTPSATISTGAWIASTSSNTASTVVERDGSGNFTAGTITASLTGAASLNVLLAGSTMTGQLVVSNAGIEFNESDTNPTCAAGNFNIFADASENKLKKCMNGSATDLDTAGGSVAFSDITAGDNSNALTTSGSFNITGSGTIRATSTISAAADPADAGIVRLGNAESICWEASPASTDLCLTVDSSEILQITAAVSATSLSEGANAVPNATDHLGFFGATTSLQLAGVLNDETGTGVVMFNTSPKIVTSILDTNGNQLFNITATASAVNEFTVANAATGGFPIFSATGDDANISIGFQPKGTGGIGILGTSTSPAYLTLSEDTDNGTNFVGITAPADAGSSNRMHTLPAVADDTIALLAATQTFTGKTYDAEGTGNVLTTVGKITFIAAICNEGTAALAWDTPTGSAATAPTEACNDTGSIQRPTASFSGSAVNGMEVSFPLPSDWTGNIDIDIDYVTTAASPSGNVEWDVSTVCRAVGESWDGSFNAAQTITDAAGSQNAINRATQASVTTTGCAAGEHMTIRIERDGTNDTNNDAALMLLATVTIRRAQ